MINERRLLEECLVVIAHAKSRGLFRDDFLGEEASRVLKRARTADHPEMEDEPPLDNTGSLTRLEGM